MIAAGTAEWQLSVSASKAPKIYGVAGKWGGPRSVYEPMRAAYLGEPYPEEESSQIQKDGHHLEPAVRAMYLDRNPGVTLLGHEVQFASDALGFPALATPDDIATLEATAERVLVQIKTDRHGAKFGKPGTDEIPMVYYVQVLWELHIARLTDPSITRAFVVVLTPFIDIEVFIVHYNPEHAAALEDAMRTFYFDNVVAGVPPEPNGSERDYDIIRSQHKDIDDTEWEIHPRLAIEFVEAREDVETAKVRLTKAKSSILDVLGRTKNAMCGGQKIAQRQSTAGGKNVALYPAKREVDTERLHAHAIQFEIDAMENAA